MRFALLLWIPCVLWGGEFDRHLPQEECQKYLQTMEDKKRLGFYSALFDMASKRESAAGAIPKILHFIWLGPKPFPTSSIQNVKGWIDRHPGWTVRFWTDLGQAAPDDRMQVRVFDKFPLEDLKECYYRCDNFGERSELLRYAILFHEGGIYVDHDVANVKPFDTLQESCDFFCGMEPLGPTVLSSSVNPSPHVLAATAQHPILGAAKKWLIDEWDRLDAQFPGTDPSSLYNRVQHRTFRALAIGIKEAHSRTGRKDVVFPPDYFSVKDPKSAVFAAHAHSGSWHQQEASADLKVDRLVNEVVKESMRTFNLVLGLACVNILLGIILLSHVFRAKKRSQA